MRVLLIFILLLNWGILYAQKGKKMTRAEYIEEYGDLAIREMKRTGIPASITLAQGILESGDGNSTLAVKANNHFGIKCHDWKGPSVRHDDDARNECFRKYRSPEKSYIDHSEFLTGKRRYAFLFELKPDDYKAWAKGLKKAGYATSPTYAKALIKIIEENELERYDNIKSAPSRERKSNLTNSALMAGGRKVYFNNRVKYIVADSGDTYEKISEELHLLSWQLPKYNEESSSIELRNGDVVYLQPKRNVPAIKHKTHMIKEGETMHSVSQNYAIKEEKLRKRNNIPKGSEPSVGAVILLRGKLNGSVPIRGSITKQPNEEEEAEFEIEIDLGS